jgi:Leucine Rich repeat
METVNTTNKTLLFNSIDDLLNNDVYKDEKSLEHVVQYLKENDKALCKQTDLNDKLAQIRDKLMTEADFTGKPQLVQKVLWLDCLHQLKDTEHPFLSVTQRINLALQTPELEIFDANSSDLSDDELALIAENFHQLKTLNIRKCNNLTSKGFEELEKFSQLQTLYLSECKGITNDDLQHLPLTLENLWLRRNGNRISEKGIEYLSHLTHMKRLVIRGCDITDKSLETLKELKELTELDLHKCPKITDEGIRHIRQFTKLQVLNLNECKQVTDEGLTPLLSSLPDLKKVNVKGTQVSDVCKKQFADKGIKIS